MSFGPILSILERVQRMLERLASRLDDDARKADAAAAAVEYVRRWLSGRTDLPPPRYRPERSLDSERLLRAEAKAGVSLTMELAPDGSAEASVNGREPFHLSPSLGSLLAILAAAFENPGTRLPAWSTKVQIATALSRALGVAVKPAHVAKLVHRLKNRLRDSGESVCIVQTNRRLGAWRVNVRGDQR